jgi:hypothetical protein
MLHYNVKRINYLVKFVFLYASSICHVLFFVVEVCVSFDGCVETGTILKVILLSQIRDSPNLEGQVPVFIPPGNGFPFFASYDS